MTSRIALEYLASIMLAVIAGIINAWAAARYGQTEKRYLIGGIASIGGIGLIFLYNLLMHRWEYLTGSYIVVLFTVQWVARLKTRRKDR